MNTKLTKAQLLNASRVAAKASRRALNQAKAFAYGWSAHIAEALASGFESQSLAAQADGKGGAA